MPEQAWIKPSYSRSQANCVEVAVRDRVVVRDTKDRTGPVLRFTPAAWREFAGHIRRTRRQGADFPARPAAVAAALGEARARSVRALIA
jgi:hypothetical protein